MCMRVDARRGVGTFSFLSLSTGLSMNLELAIFYVIVEYDQTWLFTSAGLVSGTRPSYQYTKSFLLTEPSLQHPTVDFFFNP